MNTFEGATIRDFLDGLPHIDRLNSWVRSDGGRRYSHRALVNVIYHFKNEAIKGAIARGLASHRLVGTIITCRDCGGTKRYTDHNGYTHAGCRLCSSTGKVHLRFIDTTIRAYSWLSPVGGWRDRDTHFGKWQEWPELPLPDDWKPNLPGRDMTASEIAVSMMAIEDLFPARPSQRWVSFDSWYDDGTYTDDFATYAINVGRQPETGCMLCYQPIADEANRCRCTLSNGRIQWTATICDGCYVYHGEDRWERVKATGCSELLTPEIVEWIKRHPEPSKRSAA
jgi:hypothetical protein